MIHIACALNVEAEEWKEWPRMALPLWRSHVLSLSLSWRQKNGWLSACPFGGRTQACVTPAYPVWVCIWIFFKSNSGVLEASLSHLTSNPCSITARARSTSWAYYLPEFSNIENYVIYKELMLVFSILQLQGKLLPDDEFVSKFRSWANPISEAHLCDYLKEIEMGKKVRVKL